MDTIHKYLKTLSFLLLFILAVTIAERARTISAFLNSNDAHTVAVQSVTHFLGLTTSNIKGVVHTETQMGSVVASLIDNINSLLNSDNTNKTYTNDSTIGVSAIDTPALVCVPNVVNGVEETILMWACRDGAESTRGTNFSTEGATVGSTRVQATSTTIYNIECIHKDNIKIDTTASCTVQVINPNIELNAIPDHVSAGMTATLSWNANDVQACTITSSGESSFTRDGVAGSIISPQIYNDTSFTLTCDTKTGLRINKTINVAIE